MLSTVALLPHVSYTNIPVDIAQTFISFFYNYITFLINVESVIHPDSRILFGTTVIHAAISKEAFFLSLSFPLCEKK